ncbi:hypothetical protein Daus18300_013448 [Diaporthe australafricana]|uniref:Uncharacterized protein n=1 Tax=Diaporthe australafricana TaxID=127596 RepID=A0ABR3VYY0_9PEZI
MSQQIQSFEAWGYVLNPNARGYLNVTFDPNGRHCNIFHPRAGGHPAVPINTFTVTNDPGLLKIPRAFNNSPDFDPRPKAQKLSLRAQMVSYWAHVEGRQLTNLKKIEYSSVIERNLRDLMEEIYEMKGLDEFDPFTIESMSFDPVGGFALFDFSITLT